MGIVEDEHGNAVPLLLYHQEDPADGKAEEILVKGMVLIVKEPYLKYMTDGGPGIRVDHVGDIMFLSADDPRIPARWQLVSGEQAETAMAWTTRGSDAFSQSKFRAAINL